MNNHEFAEMELERLQSIGKLKWNSKKRKWNKSFYPVTDENNNFMKWKFGQWAKPLCVFCGKILETVKENPNKRQYRYCEISHQKLHANIISRAKKKFNIKDYDPYTYNEKTYKNWVIMIPSIYEYTRDKQGKLYGEKIKERVEAKTITVTVDGKSFPYTTKSRTIKI